MRKLVWGLAALMVCGATAVYMAASYASRHPDSYLGRCAAAAVYLGTQANPFSVAGSLAHRQGSGKVAGGGVAACHHEQGEAAAVNKPVGEDCEERIEVREPAEAAEPVEPIRPEVLHDEEAPLQSEAMSPVPVVPMQTEEPQAGVEEQGLLGEIILNERNVETVPATPPNPEGEEVVPEALPMPTEDDSDDEDETSSVSNFGACAPEGTTHAGEACWPQPCEGCCWFAQMLQMMDRAQDSASDVAVTDVETPTPEAATEETTTEPEMLPMPEECGDDEPQEEGIEESDLEQTQACPQTDSYHHYHHNSCPYMGCPYPYSRAVPVMPVETPKKKSTRKKIKQSLREPGTAETLWKTLFLEEDCTTQTGVDTMEFRPSDDPRDPPGRNPF